MVIAHQLPQTSRRRHNGHFDRGAAAVEMAIVLPLLLFILMGLIDFGRAYNAQIQLNQASREGVRLASLNTTGVTTGTAAANPNGDAAIAARVSNAAGGIVAFAAGCSAPTDSSSSACITYCRVPVAVGDSAKVVLTTKFTWITGISAMSNFFGAGAFPTPTTLQSTGVMRCMG
jgi:Flp pilus assembly protein TadG